MSKKLPLIVLSISSRATASGVGGIVVLERTGEDDAVRVACKIAEETGRSVTVRSQDMRVIEVIPSVPPQ